LIVCPCCGLKFDGDLRVGCPGCGAQAVGEPLSPPEFQLPFYGRSLFLGAIGTLLILIFCIATLVAFFEGSPRYEFWSFVGAAETAAWRLKFSVLPLAIAALWGGSLIYGSIIRSPRRFAARGFARAGLIATGFVVLTFLTTIGITVPERMRQYHTGLEAAENARLYAIHHAQLRYQAIFHTVPTELGDLRKLNDPAVDRALEGIDPKGYQPRSELAVTLPKSKNVKLRGAAIRKASTGPTDDALDQGLSFTNYELRLPGPDKILGTDDDPRMVDGVLMPVVRVENGSTRNP
jgi:hypothetical protein